MQIIGHEGSLTVGDMDVDVRVLDIRTSYGQVQYEVTPVAGFGKVWTADYKVRMHAN